jgi:hypothetical protein
MARRDVFSTLRQMPPKEEGTPVAALVTAGQSEARQPLDLIPTAQRRKKRNREWERARRSETVTYRGVPLATHEWMGKLAAGLDVPRDEVVQALLEYSLGLYQSGKLVLRARPKAQHMTLFPEHRKSAPTFPLPDKKQAEWLQQAFPVSGKKAAGRKKGKRDKTEPSRWQQRVTYRVPVKLKEGIRAIAEEHTLPVGQVVWYFIEKALKAYRAGDLQLQPEPRIVRQTLFSED